MIFATERLIARRFQPRDLQPFVAMRNDSDVARFQSWSEFSEAEGYAFLDEIEHVQPGDEGWFQMALEDRGTGLFIGDCGLRIMDNDQRLAQIGYTIARTYWNRGFASEAISGLSDYAFSSFAIHRITASVDPRNIGSCRALEKAGFVKEAHFRKSEWFKGEWADDAVYARLAPD